MTTRRWMSIALLHFAAFSAFAAETAIEKPPRVAHCLEERFVEGASAVSAVVFSRDKSPKLIPADDYCLESDPASCRNFLSLDGRRQWFAGARAGNWVCVSDGTLSGWTMADQIATRPPAESAKKDWLGVWNRIYGGASFSIVLAAGKNTLHVTGTAEWRAGPDATPHLGDLDADATLVGNELHLGELNCLDYDYGEEHDECYDCVARMMLINGRILVADNHRCGGMNVNFDGSYDRETPGRKKRSR